MNKIYVIGIGFKPLERQARDAVLRSDVVLANGRLRDVFKNYNEYDAVQERIIVHDSVGEMLDYIDSHRQSGKISLLAAGDPMFFGIGRVLVERLGKEGVEIYPDLSSIQVAFSRIKETSNNALLISFHGGPDPEKRRELEYEVTELPSLLERNSKIAILTDKLNSPSVIAEEIMKSQTGGGRSSGIKMYVCEKLGYLEERIYEGTPEEIAGRPFEYPNVLIITGEKQEPRD